MSEVLTALIAEYIKGIAVGLLLAGFLVAGLKSKQPAGEAVAKVQDPTINIAKVSFDR